MKSKIHPKKLSNAEPVMGTMGPSSKAANEPLQIPTTSGQIRMWLLLAFIGTIWGATFSLAKIAAGGGGHPLGINYWQSLIGTALLLTIGLAKRQLSTFKANQAKFYIICGLLGTVIPGTLFYYAASRVSAGVLSITIATVPLMTVVAAALLGAEKLQKVRVFGVVLGIISIALLVGPKESLPDPAVIPWIFVVLIAALCYTAESLVIALRIPSGVSALMIAAGMYIAATLILTPIVIFSDTFVPLQWPFGAVEWSIISLGLVSVAAYSLFIYLIVHSGPVFASQTAYVITFTGVLWGMLIFDERHSGWLWASLTVMMLALILVKPAESKRT